MRSLGATGFVRLGARLVRPEDIREIDLDRLEQDGVVRVGVRGTNTPVELRGAEAIDLVMRIAPSFVEGKRFRWVRWGWAVHNLLGHPALQLLSWAGHTRMGLRVHDATIPRPLPRDRRLDDRRS